MKAWNRRPAWELKMLGKRNTPLPDLSAKAIIEEKKNSGPPPGWREVKNLNDVFQMFLAQKPKERQALEREDEMGRIRQGINLALKHIHTASLFGAAVERSEQDSARYDRDNATKSPSLSSNAIVPDDRTTTPFLKLNLKAQKVLHRVSSKQALQL
jgi:hypothetical protein